MLFLRTTFALSLAVTVGLSISCSANAYAIEPVMKNPILTQTDTIPTPPQPHIQTQTYTVSSQVVPVDVERDGYTATSQAELDARKKAADDAAAAQKQKEEAAAAAAQAKANAASAATTAPTASTTPLPSITPDPGSAQAEGQRQVEARGWDDSQFNCLVALWNRESGRRVNASNASSGAYGIAQALPGSKMASAGSDWQTNAATQIKWGLDYIAGRYTNPCGAWAHSEATGWY